MKTDKEMFDCIQNKIKIKQNEKRKKKNVIVSFTIICVIAIASLSIILPSLGLFNKSLSGDLQLFEKGTVNFSTELQRLLVDCPEEKLLTVTILFSNIDLYENKNPSAMKEIAQKQAEHIKQFGADSISYHYDYKSVTINISAKNLLLLTCPTNIAYFISL